MFYWIKYGKHIIINYVQFCMLAHNNIMWGGMVFRTFICLEKSIPSVWYLLHLVVEIPDNSWNGGKFHELSNVLIKNSITHMRTHEYSHMHTVTQEGLHTMCCHM